MSVNIFLPNGLFLANTFFSVKSTPVTKNGWESGGYGLVIIVTIIFVLFVALTLMIILSANMKKRIDSFEKNTDSSQPEQSNSIEDIMDKPTFMKFIQKECYRSQRYKSELSMISFGLDEYKELKRKLGDDGIENLIDKVMNIVKPTVRKTDIISKIDNNIFCVLCSDTRISGAEMLAERIRYESAILNFEDDLKVTCCFGVTGVREDDDCKTFLNRALNALTQAQNIGKDHVDVKL